MSDVLLNQDVADVNVSVRNNRHLRKCVDTILTKVRKNMFVHLQNSMLPLQFVVRSSPEHHLSFQCPSRYQEEMITDTSDRGGNVQPTERDLVSLHKKVIITLLLRTAVVKETMVNNLINHMF